MIQIHNVQNDICNCSRNSNSSLDHDSIMVKKNINTSVVTVWYFTGIALPIRM